MFTASLLILIGLYNHNVLSKRVICDFDDTNCVTEGSRRIYQVFVSGEIEGVPSSNTLCVDTIEANLPTVKYVLRNSKIHDLRNCYVEFASIDTKYKKFNYNLACKNLTLEGDYEVNGYVGSMFVEGKGDYQIDMYDYVFLLSGQIEQDIDKEGGIHVQLAKDFKFDIDPRGKVVYNLKNLYDGDEKKSAAMHKFANENWKLVDKTIHRPFMEKFMALYVDHANTFLKVLAVEHFFYQEILD
ncbi:uncharacterized protein LOC142976184 [Anticarsia gemmatalis]|uniref:uncharacterized protein LOC142976184 n=1 Tax=Anticarsia gemmatalis TaxID=129554 RepID=UPI003F769014